MTSKNDRNDAKLWGGRFSQPTADLVDAINASIDYDQRMWRQDIRGSKAWSNGLVQAGILSPEERDKIHAGLDKVAARIAEGSFAFSRQDEDIHMNVEKALTQDIGDAGAKLHTGRSRNDQVCTDVRLYVRDTVDALLEHMADLLEVLAEGATRHAEDVIPGYTHLQRAQPVTLGFHLMTWACCLSEDVERLQFARGMANRSPLGSAALAGTAYNIDRDSIARELGFDTVLDNAQMAVADRAFVLDTLHALVGLAVHLSRIGEEIILWNSQEFHRIRLSDAWSTGSSIMPQKKNPDVAELLRGKAGRIFAAYQTLAVVQKGTPFAYNKDLQEDKEPLFDALQQADLMVRSLTGMLAESSFEIDDSADVAGRGHLLATELADYLARKGVPFRDAHDVVGRAVALAEERGCYLHEIALKDYQALHTVFAQDLFEALDARTAIRSRAAIGGTHPDRVRETITRIRAQVAALRTQP